MKKIILVTLYSLLITSPLAQAGGLVPCGGPTEDPCTWCDLFSLGERIIVFLRDIAIPIGVAFIVLGGFTIMFSAGSVEKVKKGRDIIKSAVIGVAIVLAAWLILDIIFQVLSGGSTGIGPWNEIKC